MKVAEARWRSIWEEPRSLDLNLPYRPPAGERGYSNHELSPAEPPAAARLRFRRAGTAHYDTGTRVSEGRGAAYGGAWSGPLFGLTHREAPTQAGDCLRLFEAAGATPVKVEKLPTVPNPGQVTDLHFSVVG